MSKFNYKELGLKCGLEIHQQLDSKTKLFCRCPNELQGTREPDFTLKRQMRPVLGEMGTYDEAMLTEYEKEMGVIYEGYNREICTYELDETPPFQCSEEARKIALKIAALLNMNVIEEMHVCRKNYLDGSVPCGFQRTMILAKDGYLKLENGKEIGIDILCLEEDAARKSETKEKTYYYRLDRLGIPLVEVTTKPDINDPSECRETAERLGLLLWSTRVKKVLGAIRQDINVSIKGGTRIEIKGVQKLDWIPQLINHEISRQMGLIKISQRLKDRNLKPQNLPQKSVDLTDSLKNTKCKFISKGIKAGEKLYAMNFEGFEGIFGQELMEDYRFGTEVSSKVKSITGLQGIIHSDEALKKYSFSEEDISIIEEKLSVNDNDCFVLVLGKKKQLEKASNVILKRVKYAFRGVPPETRRALENGNSEFLRELHGGARLYPDTDMQAIVNTPEEINQAKSEEIRYPWEIIEEYAGKYEAEKRVFKDLIFEGKLELFESLLEIYNENPMLIITTLLETTTALSRDGKNVENISEEDYQSMFQLLAKDEIGKEAIEELMEHKTDNPDLSIEDIKDKLNIEKLSIDDLRNIIKEIVDRNEEIINEREMRAMGPLMGETMAKVRGKIDGSIVSKELQKLIKAKIKETK